MMTQIERAETEQILRQGAARYPEMAPEDGVKLLFQNEFGGGHLIADPMGSLAGLRAEYAGVEREPGAPLAEDIGNGMVRVHLRGLDEAVHPLETLNEDFVRSARLHTGERERFLEKLALLKELTRQGVFPFSQEELEEYLKGYLAAGCPPVSHSKGYRVAYRPAYRVVEKKRSLTLLTVELLERSARGEKLLVALDGRCAAGKTTLAERLAARYGWGLVHMDHFFLRPEQRTPQRYQTPGENVDHERFLEEVMLPLRAGKAAVYRPFCCQTQRLGDPVRVEPGAVTLIEGSYSCHRSLWKYYDLHVFLTLEPSLQLERIRKRNGPEGLLAFQERWIPLEEAYFAGAGLEERCEYQLEP